MNTIKIMLPFWKNYCRESNSKLNTDNAMLSPQNHKVLADIIRTNKKALSKGSRSYLWSLHISNLKCSFIYFTISLPIVHTVTRCILKTYFSEFTLCIQGPFLHFNEVLLLKLFRYSYFACAIPAVIIFNPRVFVSIDQSIYLTSLLTVTVFQLTQSCFCII